MTAVSIRVRFLDPAEDDRLGTVEESDIGNLFAVENDLARHPDDAEQRTARCRVTWKHPGRSRTLTAGEVGSLDRIGGAAPPVGR